MWRSVLVLIAGCGRIHFGALDAGGGTDDANADARIPLGLVVHYEMEDDPSDGRLEDSAGVNNPAFCQPGTTCGSVAAGRFGSAVQLQPAQCYRLPFDAVLPPGDLTVSLWVNLDPTARMVVATQLFGTDRNRWSIYLDPGGVGFESYNGAGGVFSSSTQVVPPLVWSHLAISWDGRTKRMYLDGVRVVDTVQDDFLSDAGDVTIGCDEDAGAPLAFTTGSIDDVRIYDYKLSDFDIAQLDQ